ncbi:MAG TPA: DUF6152 family protein [Caulobacteraceae bacterium]|nr:DUF6152 family protein [Caulobacteraceae bacterium]
MNVKSVRSFALIAGVLALGAASQASAHHSFAMFDMTKNVTVTGEVKDFQWTNPHVWIEVAVKGSGDKAGSSFSVECGSVSVLQKQGWTRKSLKPGDEVTVVVHPLRNDALGGSLVSASVDGKPIGRSE